MGFLQEGDPLNPGKVLGADALIWAAFIRFVAGSRRFRRAGFVPQRSTFSIPTSRGLPPHLQESIGMTKPHESQHQTAIAHARWRRVRRTVACGAGQPKGRRYRRKRRRPDEMHPR